MWTRKSLRLSIMCPRKEEMGPWMAVAKEVDGEAEEEERVARVVVKEVVEEVGMMQARGKL